MAAVVADVVAGADGHQWGTSVVVEVGRRGAAGTPQRVHKQGLKPRMQTAAGLPWEALRDPILARDLAAADLIPQEVVDRMCLDLEQVLVAQASRIGLRFGRPAVSVR